MVRQFQTRGGLVNQAETSREFQTRTGPVANEPGPIGTPIVTVGLTGVGSTMAAGLMTMALAIVPVGVSASTASGTTSPGGVGQLGNRQYQTPTGTIYNTFLLGTDYQSREGFHNDPGDLPTVDKFVTLTTIPIVTTSGLTTPTQDSLALAGYSIATMRGTITVATGTGNVTLTAHVLTVTTGAITITRRLIPVSMIGALAPGAFTLSPTKQLVGLSMSGMAGSVGTSGGVSGINQPISGHQLTSTHGTITPRVSEIQLTGLVAGSPIGTITPTVSVPLTGHWLIADELMGQMTPSIEVAITGAGLVSAFGTLAVAGDTSVTLTPSLLTSTTAAIMPGTSITLTQIAATGTLGSPVSTSAVVLVGIPATSTTGTISRDYSLPVSGILLLSQHGTVSTPNALNQEIRGYVLTSNMGPLGIVTTGAISLTAVVSTSTLGQFSFGLGLVGHDLTSAVGAMLGGDLTLTLTGVTASGQIGHFRFGFGTPGVAVVTITGGTYIPTVTLVGGEFHG